MMKRRLYILHKLPTPYNDDLMRAIHHSGDIELQVYHLWRGSDRRPWKEELAQGYPNHFMSSTFGIDMRSLRRALEDKDSLFMVGDWAHSAPLALVMARLLRRAPVTLWVDTPQEHLPRPLLKRVPRTVFLRWLLRRVDGIFASGKPANRVLREMGAPASSIIDFQFLVDLDRPERARQRVDLVERAARLRASVGCDQTGTVFVMSATIDLKKKAQDLGIRALARARTLSDQPIGLLIAGTGAELETLKALARDLDLGDSVSFLGWQEPDEMDALYLASDSLLHPAHYDPFPLVVMEAMSFGCAVVGTSTSGSVEERVVDGVSGYQVPPGDVNAMADAMARLANDPSHTKAAGEAARTTAETWPIERGVDIIRQTMNRLLRPAR